MKLVIVQIDRVPVAEVPYEFLDAGNYDEFVREINLVLDGCSQLVLDFHRVHFIDSSGIGTLLFAQRKLARTGGTLGVCNIRENLHDDLKRLHLHRLVDVFDTKEEAVEKYASALVKGPSQGE
jgi:anti-anti-sigma factor